MSIKISELPETSTIGNDDLIAIVQENSTKKIKFSNFIEQGKQITIINEQYTKEYYLDENFKTLVAQPITEGIYYNITPTTNPVKLITSYDEETYGYTTIPYGSYLVIYPVDIKSSGMIGATDRFYKYLLITRGDSADDRIHIISGISEAFKSTGFMPRQFMTNTISEFENTADRVGTVDENSTDEQYPSAEAVYEALQLKQAEIDELLSQIPTAIATGETINVQDSSNLPIKDFAMLGNATQADTSTPDTPQDIHVVTGDNTVKVLGKNWLNLTNRLDIKNNGVTSSNYKANSFHCSGGNSTWTNSTMLFPNYKKNTDFSISANFLETAIAHSARITIYGTDTSPIDTNTFTSLVSSDSVPLTLNTATNISTTFNSGDYKYIAIRFWANPTATALSSATNFDISEIQLEESTTATPFEPYTLQEQLLSLGSIELAKIGDYTDRIFKSGGKWYLYKATDKFVLNGTENWSASASLKYFYLNDNTIKLASSDSSAEPSYSNYYVVCSYNALYNTTVDYGFGFNQTNPRLYIRNKDMASLQAFQTWLSTHNTIVYYILATPTTTEITDTTLIAQLENILAMHTNKNVTNAWLEPSGNNAQGGLTLTYYRDLQTITDKIDSLEARVTLLE